MSSTDKRKNLIVGISGASGAIFGIRVLEMLGKIGTIASHLILTEAGRRTIEIETDWTVSAVEKLADVVYSPDDIGAAPASGSFLTAGMIVAPCSIKTLSGIANSYNEELLIRAADVQLKEGRPVVLLVRETPLHPGHLRLMVNAASSGAVIMPPVPAFYGKPETLDDVIDGVVGRALLRLGVENQKFHRWNGD